MEVNLNLPVPARWVPGQRAGSNILVDPYNVKMWPKSSDTNNKYYICSRRRDLGCMVRVTVRKTDDQIVFLRGEHNHDSDLLKSLVHEKRQEVIANAVENDTVAPRTAFVDLTNKVSMFRYCHPHSPIAIYVCIQ